MSALDEIASGAMERPFLGFGPISASDPSATLRSLAGV